MPQGPDLHHGHGGVGFVVIVRAVVVVVAAAVITNDNETRDPDAWLRAGPKKSNQTIILDPQQILTPKSADPSGSLACESLWVLYPSKSTIFSYLPLTPSDTARTLFEPGLAAPPLECPPSRFPPPGVSAQQVPPSWSAKIDQHLTKIEV